MDDGVFKVIERGQLRMEENWHGAGSVLRKSKVEIVRRVRVIYLWKIGTKSNFDIAQKSVQ